MDNDKTIPAERLAEIDAFATEMMARISAAIGLWTAAAKASSQVAVIQLPQLRRFVEDIESRANFAADSQGLKPWTDASGAMLPWKNDRI